jgi:hypothetical protein
MSQFRLSPHGGDAGEAWAYLSDVYRRFKEGFETDDLRTARELLAEIAAPEDGASISPHMT